MPCAQCQSAYRPGAKFCEQNRAVGESPAPQLAHVRGSGAPHCSQNFAPGRYAD